MALWKFWNTWNNNLTAILGYAPEHTASHSLLNPSFLCHFHFRKKMCRYLPQNISKYDHENQTCWVDIEEVIFMCQWAWVLFSGLFYVPTGSWFLLFVLQTQSAGNCCLQSVVHWSRTDFAGNYCHRLRQCRSGPGSTRKVRGGKCTTM